MTVSVSVISLFLHLSSQTIPRPFLDLTAQLIPWSDSYLTALLLHVQGWLQGCIQRGTLSFSFIRVYGDFCQKLNDQIFFFYLLKVIRVGWMVHGTPFDYCVSLTVCLSVPSVTFSLEHLILHLFLWGLLQESLGSFSLSAPFSLFCRTDGAQNTLSCYIGPVLGLDNS